MQEKENQYNFSQPSLINLIKLKLQHQTQHEIVKDGVIFLWEIYNQRKHPSLGIFIAPIHF